VYIGQTRVDPQKRHKQHLDQAKKGGSNRLSHALNEFGENYQFEVMRIFSVDDPDKLLAVLDDEEMMLIKLYHSNEMEHGYNSTIGTWHFFHPHIKTEDEKALEQYKRNVFAAEYADRKISNEYDAIDLWGEVSDGIDNLTEEEKEEIVKQWWQYNGIVGYDDDNNVLGLFRNVKEIASALDVGGNCVRNVLSGKQKKAYGYNWKYGKDYFVFDMGDNKDI